MFFVTAERFMNEMILRDSARYDARVQEPLPHRRPCVLIDDIQFLAGKESTQEEFFHTFNTLHGAHKQIVLTSDGPPIPITALEERLISRFTWGVVARSPGARPPKPCVAIVRKKAEIQGRNLPNEIALLLAGNIKTNIRDLEGSLLRPLAFSDLTGQPLTVEFAQEVLREQIKPDLARVDVLDIQRAVARHFSSARSRSEGSAARKPSRSRGRWGCTSRGRSPTSLWLRSAPGSCGRDHTTVMHACQKIET